MDPMTLSYPCKLRDYGIPAALICGEQPQRLVQSVLQLSSLHGLEWETYCPYSTTGNVIYVDGRSFGGQDRKAGPNPLPKNRSMSQFKPSTILQYTGRLAHASPIRRDIGLALMPLGLDALAKQRICKKVLGQDAVLHG